MGYRNFAKPQQKITRYIIRYYCQFRPLQNNGGLTPNESERLYWENSKTTAKFSWQLHPLIWQENFLKNMDYYEARQTFYSSVYNEFNFSTNYSFTILVDNKTIARYLLINQTLQELREWLLTLMSNRSLAKMTDQQLFYNSSIEVDDSGKINTKNAMSARL